MDRKTKIILSASAIIIIIYFLTRKKEKVINVGVLPNFVGLDSNKERYFLINDKSKHIKDFKENVNAVGTHRFGVKKDDCGVCEIAHEDFMTVAEALIGNEKICDGERLSVDFVKDFNIIVGRLTRNDFKAIPNQMKQPLKSVYQKGDKKKEIEYFKQNLNHILNADVLSSDGAYSNNMYEITSEIFKDTSVFDDSEQTGKISQQFMITFNNLIKNQTDEN